MWLCCLQMAAFVAPALKEVEPDGVGIMLGFWVFFEVVNGCQHFFYFGNERRVF
jgi:hypothetical protein